LIPLLSEGQEREKQRNERETEKDIRGKERGTLFEETNKIDLRKKKKSPK